MKTQDRNVVQVADGRIIIGPVIARWPNLATKNTQFGEEDEGRYTVAVVLKESDAETLQHHMKEKHDSYVGANAKSAEMTVAPFGKDVGNGNIQFELQNRLQKPDIIDAKGKPYDNLIADRSTVVLVAEPVTYTDNRSKRTGVSLRIKAVQLLRKPTSDLELLRRAAGLDSVPNDVNGDSGKEEGWDPGDIWDE